MNDLISREAALDALKGFNVVDMISYEHGVIYVQAVINAIYNRLNNLPSAVSERTAKVETYTDGQEELWSICECETDVRKSYNYCPGCGAKLEWSENE